MNNGITSPAGSRSDRWTVPNVLCLIRLAGSLVLVAIALAGASRVFLAIFLLLALSDYVDGRIAKWLNQQTSLGALLDTVADISLFGAVLFGAVWMRGDVLAAEWQWLAAPVGCFAASVVASYAKFRKFPSYHTRVAKTANLLMLVAAAALFGAGAVWPLRIACVAVALANLEAVAITWVLPRSQIDVRSLYHALQSRHRPVA